MGYHFGGPLSKDYGMWGVYIDTSMLGTKYIHPAELPGPIYTHPQTTTKTLPHMTIRLAKFAPNSRLMYEATRFKGRIIMPGACLPCVKYDVFHT